MQGVLMIVSDRLQLKKRDIVNLLGAIAAYCLFPKKPCINVQRTIDTQFALF